MKQPWLQTYSGKVITLEHPTLEDIDIEDIAHALAYQCRFGGNTKQFYSIAEHSVRVAHELPQSLALWGLLHDASEAYILDVPRPLKEYLNGRYKQLESIYMNVICEKFGLIMPEPPEVKVADNALLVTERRDLMIEQEKDWGIDAKPLYWPIVPWSSEAAEINFLYEFANYSQWTAQFLN